MIAIDSMQLIENISKELNVPPEMLTKALKQSRTLVKHIIMKKRNGSDRTVYQPSKKLKIIQYWLINNIFVNLKVHYVATAFLKNTSIKNNVLRHTKGRYFLKLDIKDFFPSIKFNDLQPIISKWITEKNLTIIKSELLQVVRLSCFYINDYLPIGYPSSPIISNIVMCEFDDKIIASLSDTDQYGVTAYTRYADDMTFSTNTKGACNNIKHLVEKTLAGTVSPKLKLNSSKTTFVSSSGGSALVTGLRICHDGHLTIHRKYKDKVRSLFYSYKKGVLEENDIYSLKGHLAHIRHVDGLFYTKLQNKHFKEIQEILSIKLL